MRLGERGQARRALILKREREIFVERSDRRSKTRERSNSRRRTQDRVRLEERTGTMSQSSFCKHLYRYTEIIEKPFFLHIVCLCIFMNECCGCVIIFICSMKQICFIFIEFYNNVLDSLGCVRSAQQNI